jgi:SAM-dependent methyltransferase
LSAIYRLAAQFCRGEGVDVGCVSDKICEPMPGAKPVDPVIPDSGTAEHIPYPDGSQDFVFSSHCWEHCPYPEAVAREAHRVLKPGGVLFLYLPFPGRPDWDPALNEEVRAVHRWQPDPSGLGRLLLFVGFTIDYLEWAADPHDSFVVIARKPDAIQRSQ